MERYFKQRDAEKAKLAEKACKEKEIQLLNEALQKWDQEFSCKSDENFSNLPSELGPDRNPLSKELVEHRPQSLNSQLNESFCDPSSELNLNPLKSFDQTSASNFAPARAQSSDIQLDENLITSGGLEENPLEDFKRTSAFENETSHPLKSFGQTSDFKKGTSHPLKSSDRTSDFKNGTSYPLKSSGQTSELNLAPTRGESPNLQLDENLIKSEEFEENPLKSSGQTSDFENRTSHPLKKFRYKSAFVRIKSLLDRFNKNRILKTENYIRLKISNTKPVVRAKFGADALLSGYSWRGFVKIVKIFLDFIKPL